MTTIIGFLLDETGSMQSIADDTIGGFNSYLDGLGKLTARVTLASFDSNRFVVRSEAAKPRDVERLSRENYRPGAMTPLIDSAMRLISMVEKTVKSKDRVNIVIQTDGHENASSKHTRADLAAKVKKLTKKGWEFIYLGAGIDAFAEAASFGISKDKTLNYGKQKSGETFDLVSRKTAAYAATGQSMSWSTKDRSATK